MSDVATTKMSSKGQVVIPEEIRESLGLEAGTRFVVVGEGDAIVLKRIAQPSLKELRPLLAKARKSAKRAGVKRLEVEKAVQRSRHGKR